MSPAQVPSPPSQPHIHSYTLLYPTVGYGPCKASQPSYIDRIEPKYTDAAESMRGRPSSGGTHTEASTYMCRLAVYLAGIGSIVAGSGRCDKFGGRDFRADTININIGA